MKYIITFFCAMYLGGCVSITDINSFKIDTSEMDLYDIKRNIDTDPGGFMTWKGENEYLVEVEGLEIATIHNTFSNIVRDSGFTVSEISNGNNVIVAERGLLYSTSRSINPNGLSLSSNEWGMIAAVYIFDGSPLDTVYVRVQITQDITGGFGVNRAEKIVGKFCEIMQENCIRH